MIKNLGNKELVEKYEKIGIELNNIFMELCSRFENKELTKEEMIYVIEIGTRRGSELVDRFNVNKNDMKDGFSELIEILSDENR